MSSISSSSSSSNSSSSSSSTVASAAVGATAARAPRMIYLAACASFTSSSVAPGGDEPATAAVAAHPSRPQTLHHGQTQLQKPLPPQRHKYHPQRNTGIRSMQPSWIIYLSQLPPPTTLLPRPPPPPPPLLRIVSPRCRCRCRCRQTPLLDA